MTNSTEFLVAGRMKRISPPVPLSLAEAWSVNVFYASANLCLLLTKQNRVIILQKDEE